MPPVIKAASVTDQDLANHVQMLKSLNFDQFDDSRFHVQRHNYFFRQQFAGTELQTSLFTGSAASGDNVTNLKNAKQFDQDIVAFRLETVRIGVDWAATLAGGPSTGTVTMHESTLVTAILPVVRTIQSFWNNASFSLKIGKRDLILPTPGLGKFPEGQGWDGAIAVATTASTTSLGALFMNNGVAAVANKFEMEPYMCFGGDSISSFLTQVAANALTTSVMIKFALEGRLLTVQSR